MSILTFKGGVHPVEGKELSKSVAIRKIEPKCQVAIAMGQHIGAPASPVVTVGERVLVNQLIGEGDGVVTANIHSSVSGIIVAIEDRMMLNGNKSLCVVIEDDGKYEEIDYKIRATRARKSIIDAIKEAGIVGMGGAGFPTHVKLSPKNPNDIEYIIVNGAECEPYLTSDYRKMMERPNELVEGLNIILSLFKNAKGIIAVEDNKMDAIINLRNYIKDYERISLKTVFTKYPQGGERTLIKAVTGREINSKMLPADALCIVNNVDTVCAIYNAVKVGVPLTKRIITVSGDAICSPCNLEVPIGTPVSKVIEEAGGFIKQPEKIISGGPMMGTAIYDLDAPVTKGTSAILCFTKDEVAKYKPSNCINCGRCASVCPGQIIPSRVALMAEHDNKSEFLKLNGMECCECGCCSYICPAKRNLTQSIKTMRKNILASRKK